MAETGRRADISDQLWEEYNRIRQEKGEMAAKQFLDEEREFTVWHGTRRKETPKELKKYGFCSYTAPKADKWLEDEARKAVKSSKLTFNGESIAKRVNELKRAVREPGRQVFSVTAIEEDVPSWADRNPEFMYDLLTHRLPREEWQAILREKFGRKVKVTLKLKLPVRQVLGVPQDIHTGIRCFSPDQIIDVTLIGEEE